MRRAATRSEWVMWGIGIIVSIILAFIGGAAYQASNHLFSETTVGAGSSIANNVLAGGQSTVTQTTTQTMVSTQITTQLITTTSVSTTTPPSPSLVEVTGTVNTSTFGTSPAKLIVQGGSSGPISVDLTLSPSHTYDVRLTNGVSYTFHVYWNITPVGSGDKVCATLQVTVGPNSGPLNLDLNC